MRRENPSQQRLLLEGPQTPWEMTPDATKAKVLELLKTMLLREFRRKTGVEIGDQR